MKRAYLLLSAMMFLQMMVFPVWFNTVIPYFQTLPGGSSWAVGCGALMSVGMLASPLVCMVADRFLDSGRVIALCNFVSGLFLLAAFFSAVPWLLFALLFCATVISMPTWSLVAAVSMAHAPIKAFPFIRALGSVGWTCSAVFSVVAIQYFHFESFDKSPWIFAAAAAVSFASGFWALLLPATPPRGADDKTGIVDVLGLRALCLMKDREFCRLMISLLVAMIAFLWYLGYNTMYLDERGFKYLSLVQNIGSAVELGFMVLIPLILKKLGFHRAILLAMAALAVRYVSFLAGYESGLKVFDYLGIGVHGLIFGLLIVAVQMHVAEIAPEKLRNQAQGLVMNIVVGIGGLLSAGIFDRVLACSKTTSNAHDWGIPFVTAIILAVVAIAILMSRRLSSAKHPIFRGTIDKGRQ